VVARAASGASATPMSEVPLAAGTRLVAGTQRMHFLTSRVRREGWRGRCFAPA
jgi:hypothetical protein